jgi:hypothetical protein
MFLQNLGCLSMGYIALSQKTKLFIITAMRSSNPGRKNMATKSYIPEDRSSRNCI